jgi:aryl-alcohol dehydrogenase-like predicted oxidoreductase
METRRLGRQGLEVSAPGLGCIGMNRVYPTGAEGAECEETLLPAVDAGVTLFDTAEVFGPWRDEELPGRVLGARRDRLVLATNRSVPCSRNIPCSNRGLSTASCPPAGPGTGHRTDFRHHPPVAAAGKPGRERCLAAGIALLDREP